MITDIEKNGIFKKENNQSIIIFFSDNSSGYDSTDEEIMTARARSVPPPSGLRAAR